MKASERHLQSDVSKLPAKTRQLIERMLIEGATFEDAVEAVKERGGDGVTLQAVQDFFRSNLALQQQRIMWQLKTAKALKKALGNPRSGQAELAQAVLLTGLMHLNRRGGEFDLNDAMRHQVQMENQKLKGRVLRLREQMVGMQQAITKARLKSELAKWELTKVRVTELHRSLEQNEKQERLGPETIRKIQEIYGLISESSTEKNNPASQG